MAQKLAKQLGLVVGISSGANLIGAIQLQNQLGPCATVVAVLFDSNKKYLSTDLVKEEPVKEGYFLLMWNCWTIKRSTGYKN